MTSEIRCGGNEVVVTASTGAALPGVVVPTTTVVPTAAVVGSGCGAVLGPEAVTRGAVVGLAAATKPVVVVGLAALITPVLFVGLVLVVDVAPRLVLVVGLVPVVTLAAVVTLVRVVGLVVEVVGAVTVGPMWAPGEVVVGPLIRLGGAIGTGLGPATMTIGSSSKGTVTPPADVVVPMLVSFGLVIS
jgi:hypothetical protein